MFIIFFVLIATGLTTVLIFGIFCPRPLWGRLEKSNLGVFAAGAGLADDTRGGEELRIRPRKGIHRPRQECP